MIVIQTDRTKSNILKTNSYSHGTLNYAIIVRQNLKIGIKSFPNELHSIQVSQVRIINILSLSLECPGYACVTI